MEFDLATSESPSAAATTTPEPTTSPAPSGAQDVTSSLIDPKEFGEFLAGSEPAKTPEKPPNSDNLPFHEHPRWKEVQSARKQAEERAQQAEWQKQQHEEKLAQQTQFLNQLYQRNPEMFAQVLNGAEPLPDTPSDDQYYVERIAPQLSSRDKKIQALERQIEHLQGVANNFLQRDDLHSTQQMLQKQGIPLSEQELQNISALAKQHNTSIADMTAQYVIHNFQDFVKSAIATAQKSEVPNTASAMASAAGGGRSATDVAGLSARQLAIAKASGMTPAEYAREYARTLAMKTAEGGR